ncbi:hypothetical protein SRIMM317S_04566 [Streptomyces rimosus subsp. rimosus]
MSLFGKLLPAIGEGFAPPETVAGVIAMLASEDGAFITGTEIRIDGGTHMRQGRTDGAVTAVPRCG